MPRATEWCPWRAAFDVAFFGLAAPASVHESFATIRDGMPPARLRPESDDPFANEIADGWMIGTIVKRKTEFAKRAGRIGGTPRGFCGGEFVNEESAKRFLRALARGIGSGEELNGLLECWSILGTI